MLGKLTVLFTLALVVCIEACPKCANEPISAVCGSDGRTYKKVCNLLRRQCLNPDLDLTILFAGTCPDYAASFPQPLEKQPKVIYKPINCTRWNMLGDFPCPRTFNRKCGNDLENYDNVCEMCRQGKAALNIRHGGRCTNFELALNGKAYPVAARAVVEEIQPLRFPMTPNCRNGFVPCPMTYGRMVCGSDGITYASECELCNRKRDAQVANRPFDVKIVKIGGIC